MSYVKPADIIEKGERTVTMLFPSKVVLNVGGKFVEFPEGVHEVPEKFNDHWYLKAHGVKVYDRPQYPPPKPFEATEAHLAFAQKAGIQGLETVADVEKFVRGLDPSSRESFLKDFGSFSEEDEDEKPPDLSKMTKEQLINHASEVHNVELDPKLKKDEMIEAIEAARKTG